MFDAFCIQYIGTLPRSCTKLVYFGLALAFRFVLCWSASELGADSKRPRGHQKGVVTFSEAICSISTSFATEP